MVRGIGRMGFIGMAAAMMAAQVAQTANMRPRGHNVGNEIDIDPLGDDPFDIGNDYFSEENVAKRKAEREERMRERAEHAAKLEAARLTAQAPIISAAEQKRLRKQAKRLQQIKG